MLTGSVKTTTTESVNNTVTQGPGGLGTFFPVDLTPSVAYDIELTASAGAFEPSTKTVNAFIVVV
jgi:hypothetical protein